MIFVAYAAAMLLSLVWLWATPLPREQPEPLGGSWRTVFSLLRDRYLLVCFAAIVLVVGFEICLMTVVPKLLLAHFAVPIEDGGLGCSMYYAAKTAGTFLGALILVRVSPLRFFRVSTILLIAAFAAFSLAGSVWMVFASLFVIGLAGANIFAIVFSLGLQHRPEAANDISALMITGITGGAVLPPLMGLVSDAAGLQVSLVVPLLAAVLILWTTWPLNRK